MDDVDFQQAKAMYIAARKKERARIRSALQGAGFQVKSGNNAGQGLRSYTSGGRLSPPFDLSNWMWIEAQRDGIWVIVSLQVLDQDPHSLNIHALMDRVGFQVLSEESADPDTDPLFEKCTTGFTLPLTDADLHELIAFIESQAEMVGE